MPYTSEHKTRTRTRIVECARLMFNRKGFDQVSIDEIMKGAGLTRGGFYNHFSSKEDLYAEAVRSFSACNPFARTRGEVINGNTEEARALTRRLTRRKQLYEILNL